MSVDIGIVVITFNSNHCIEQCIQDAQASLRGADLSGQICVYENGSNDGTTEKLRRLEAEQDNLKVIYAEENQGTTVSRNAAMQACDSDYFLVLDSDAFLTAECLKGMHEFMQHNPEFGMLGPKLTYASGNFQLSYDDFPTLQRKFERFLFLKKMEKAPEPHAQLAEVDYLISACWLFRRDVYQQIGGLDENIFYAPEDVDYCIRVWKAGYKIGYLPSVSMVHDAQELSRGFVLNKFKLLHAKGLLYYFNKHGYMFGLDVVRRQIKQAVEQRKNTIQSERQ